MDSKPQIGQKDMSKVQLTVNTDMTNYIMATHCVVVKNTGIF